MSFKNIWQIEHHSILPSTNDYCIEQAELGRKENLAVLADAQTAPRASRGRKWIEPKGNLNFSLLYWPQLPVKKPNWFPFVAALALYDAIYNLCDNSHNLSIKWPNDLLFGNKKVGGILIERSINVPTCFEWIVIGFGVNVYSTPSLNREISCLREFSTYIPSTSFLSQKITEFFDYWLQYLNNGYEYKIRQAWLKRSLPLHTPLTVAFGNNRWDGIYYGINEEGLLILKTQDGDLKEFSVGEVLWSYHK